LQLRLQRSVYTSGSVIVTWNTVSHQTGAYDFSPRGGSVMFTNAQQAAEISLSIADDHDDEYLEVST